MSSKKGYRGGCAIFVRNDYLKKVSLVFKCGKKYKAQIQIRGIQTYLGLFDNEIEAAKAYDAYARSNSGPRAKTNFPNTQEVKLTHAYLSQLFVEKPRFKNKRLYCGIKKGFVAPSVIPTVISKSSLDDDEKVDENTQHTLKNCFNDDFKESLGLIDDFGEVDSAWTMDENNTFVW